MVRLQLDAQNGNNYVISFLWTNSFANTSEYASVYIHLEQKFIEYEDILRLNNVPKEAVVLAVSYLGEYE